VRGLPTNCFMDAKGESISSIPGYLPTDKFIKILKFIQTDSYKTMSFSQFEEKM
jgi:thioredoxin-related protein